MSKVSFDKFSQKLIKFGIATHDSEGNIRNWDDVIADYEETLLKIENFYDNKGIVKVDELNEMEFEYSIINRETGEVLHKGTGKREKLRY